MTYNVLCPKHIKYGFPIKENENNEDKISEEEKIENNDENIIENEEENKVNEEKEEKDNLIISIDISQNEENLLSVLSIKHCHSVKYWSKVSSLSLASQNDN